MLTGIRVTVVGGDARQLEVIRRLNELDAILQLIGFDALETPIGGVRMSKLVPQALAATDAMILPVVGTDDNGRIESVFTSEELTLTDELMGALPKHVRVFTGMAKPYLKNLCETFSIRLTELLDRDDVAIFNSIPTAEGAIVMAIQNTDFTIHGAKSMVLGMGRTGITMARTLQGLGSRVLAGVRKPEHYARAWEAGFEPFYMGQLQERVESADLIFNTVPSLILTAEVIARMPKHVLIVDLASRPGGTDFRYAEKRGIKALLAPGLPGIVAPKTAGRILADTLGQLLLEDVGKGRNRE
jgi:dipicolinate synthase subunit A